MHEIENQLFERILDDFLYAEGKETKKEFVGIRRGVKMWFANFSVGCAMLNIFSLITKD